MTTAGNYRTRPNMPAAEKGDEYADSRRRGIPKGNGITFPRWLLFPSGALFTLFGLFGPAYRHQLDGLVDISRRRGFAFIGFGLLLSWIAGTWSVNARKSSTRALGWLLAGNGLLRLMRRLTGSKSLRSFESLLYVGFGVSFLAAGYWRRPFDYRD
jgi:hypothetical protein